VCLVDLDLRRPYVANFFGLVGAAGLTDVALGHVELAAATHRIDVDSTGLMPATGVPQHLVLDVMPSGPLPPNPGEFVQSPALAQIILDLRDRYDVVIIDTPPLLKVGDALSLSARVDGMLVVARMNVVRRPMASELRRLLATAPCRVVGLALTGAESDDAYGYGAGYSYSQGYAPRAPEHVK
jgi:Mrp family chromosome partitioning ATPase